jgi:hypothetical protein
MEETQMLYQLSEGTEIVVELTGLPGYSTTGKFVDYDRNKKVLSYQVFGNPYQTELKLKKIASIDRV